MNHKAHVIFNCKSRRYLAIILIASMLLFGCNMTGEYYVYLGDKYYVNEEYDKAIEAYQMGLRGGSTAINVYNNLGLIYHFEKMNYTESEKFFKKGIKLYPGVSSLHNNLSQLYFDMGNLESAIEEYTLAVKYAENTIPVISIEKLKELLEKKRYNNVDSMLFFKRILTVNPHDYRIRLEIAMYYTKRKQYEAALEEYKKILEDKKDIGEVYFEMGTCYYNLGDKKRSLASFKKALDLGEFVPDEFFEKIKHEIQGGKGVKE